MGQVGKLKNSKTVNKSVTNRHIKLLQNAEKLLYNSPKLMCILLGCN